MVDKFKGQFFGQIPETREIIPIHETTKEAFENMIKYVYRESIDWTSIDAIDMFEVANLAENQNL